MAELQKWHKLSQEEETQDDEEEEEEEALSLSDFPLKPNSPSTKSNLNSSNPTDDFEFRISFSGLESDFRTDMCAADDVFFNGTILPLRPSLSSRTDSLDLSVSSSTVMSTSRSGSSNSSGTSSHCVSRSHSTKSIAGAQTVPDPPRGSMSNNFFCTFPSPSPQIRTGGRRSNASSSRKSFSSVSTGKILRLGVIPAPEIDIRSRRASEKKPTMVAEKKQLAFGGFGCKCIPDEVIEPVGTPVSRSKMEGGKKTKKKNIGGDEEEEKMIGKKGLSLNLKRAESLCRTRIFDWLEDLSIGKSSQF